MEIVDSHCHLFLQEFEPDFSETLDRARRAGLTAIVNVGLDLETSRTAVEMAGLHPGLHPTVGWHPSEIETMTDADVESLVELAAEPEVRAFGEIGLDFHRGAETREIQLRGFEKLLDAAALTRLPVVLHVRDAWPETFALIEERRSKLAGVLIHCFSGGLDELAKGLELDCHVSFTGALTFPKAGDLREVAAKTPPHRVLIETDAPFLTPAPHRGHRNEPALITRQIDVLACLLGMTPEEAATLTAENAKNFFHLDANGARL
jgi:TatD DNase family protein